MFKVQNLLIQGVIPMFYTIFYSKNLIQDKLICVGHKYDKEA